MSDDPFKQEAQDQSLKAPRTVLDPLGNPVVVPEGMTVKEVVDRMQLQFKEDVELRRHVMKTLQVRESGEIGDPTDPVFRRGHLARQVDGPVEPGDIQDFLLRMDLARSDLMSEKLAKLKEHLPDNEYRMAEDIDGSPVIMYRATGATAYREVESPEFSMGDVAALAGGVLSEDVAGEILAFLGSRGSTSIVQGMFRAAAGGAAGEGVKSFVESQRGFEHSESGPITERIVSTGVAGAAGVLVFDPVARIINKIRGVKGFVVPQRPEAAQSAMQVASRRNLPELTPGQIHPVYESLQQQATGTTAVMQEFQFDQLHNVVTRMAEIRDDLGDFTSLSDAALTKFIDQEEKKILSAMGSIPEMTFATAGRKVMLGLDTFQTALAEREARLYRVAFDASAGGATASKGVRFNLNPAQQVATAIRNRIVTDFDFAEIGSKVSVPLTPINNPGFRMALEDLVKLQPEVRLTQGNASPLEQMVRLRSTFVNLASDPRLTGTERASSASIAKVLTDSMMNPRTLRGQKGQLKPTIKRKWRQAASASIARERFNDRVFSRFTAASDTPSQIAKKINPGKPDLVKETRRALQASRQPQAWQAVRSGFTNNLLNNPASIRSKFKNWKGEALDMLVDPRDQQALLTISDQWARLEKSNVRRMLRSGTSVGTRAVELVRKGSREEIKELISVTGGRDSATGKALQAGVLEALLHQSTKIVKGRHVIDKDRFLQGIKSFRDRGVLEEIFDTKTTNNIIDDLELYVSYLPKGMGAGEGIQKAEAASAIAGFAFPTPMNIGRGMRGIATLGKNRVISWAMITPGARRFMTRSPESKTPPKTNRYQQMGGALAVIFDNMEEAADTGSLDSSFEDVVPDVF